MRVEASVDRMGCSDCERIREGSLAQPVNTMTSAAFLVAAVPVLLRAHRAQAHGAAPAAYAAVLGLVGVGSIAFHGPQPPGAQALHDWPIAGLAALIVGTPVARAFRGQAPLPGLTRRRGLFLAATGATAGLAWWGGRTGARTCDPDSLLQWHGLWHVLAALGFAQAADILYPPLVDH